MRKSIVFIIILLLLLCGCNSTTDIANPSESTDLEYPLQVESPQTLSEQTKDLAVDLSESESSLSPECHNISLPKNNTFISICYADGAVYYIAQEYDKLENWKTARQYMARYDIKNAESSIIIEHSDFSDVHDINEICSTKNFLFYVQRNTDSSQEIHKLSIPDYSMTVIAEYPYYMTDLVLYADDGYVTWYTLENDELVLNIYNIKDSSTEHISGLVTESAFSRPIISSGITAYIKETENSREIYCYNLAEHKEEKCYNLKKEILPENLQANNKYILFNDGSDHNSPLYCIFRDTGIMSKISFGGPKKRIFSIHMFNDLIVINDRVGDDVIKILNMKTRSYTTLAGRKYSLDISEDGVFVAYDFSIPEILILNLTTR